MCSNKLLPFLLRFVFELLILHTSGALASPQSNYQRIAWREWRDDIFEQAKAEHRLVLLDLEAVWCHWCHVMDEKTYSDREIAGILREHFLAIKVDQDSRPDIANRYRDYGWPATIVFNSKGRELLKRAGYIDAVELSGLLRDAVQHPDKAEETNSAPIFSQVTSLFTDLKRKLEQNYEKSWDREKGGLNLPQKFLDDDSLEYALLTLDLAGNDAKKSVQDLVTLTLTNNLKLVDPVWGGVYQYSTNYNWDHPHFEKIVPTQAKNLRMYALGAVYFDHPRFMAAAFDVHRYLTDFLRSPEGTFYTSQDADVNKGEKSPEYFALDDHGRRAAGIPAIDTHVYAGENGLLIAALTTLYASSGKEEALVVAGTAAKWILAHRSIPGGGFRHEENDPAGPFLHDTLAMGDALLRLYATTAEREWLPFAKSAGEFIINTFKAKVGNMPGFVTAAAKTGAALQPLPYLPENIIAARFFNLLHRYTGEERFREAALSAFRCIASPGVALRTISEPGILVVDYELSNEPLHVAIVGPKKDETAKKLFLRALAFPRIYKRTEWLDRREGPLPANDVPYPELPRPAAFVCTNRRCSLPIFDPAALDKLITSMSANK